MSPSLPATCVTCGGRGLVSDVHARTGRRPRWCRCTGRQIPGYVAQPGVIVRIAYRTAEQAADRDAALAITNHYIAVKDERSDAYYGTPTMRRRSEKSAAVAAGRARFDAACAALDALQAACPHHDRALWAPNVCDRCGAEMDEIARAA